jgi:ABC-type multidrug transport system fused ATPase/permease subunit
MKTSNPSVQPVQLKKLMQAMEVRPTHFILPLALSLGVALFEGISVGILLPLAKGIFDMDFSFMHNAPLIRNIVARFHNYPNSSVFIILVSIVFLAACMKNVLRYFGALSIAYQMRRCSSAMRCHVFNRYLSFGKLFFDRQNTGYLHGILTAYTTHIANELIHLQEALNLALMLIIYLVIMYFISWKLTFFVLMILPLLYLFFKWLIVKMTQTSYVFAKAFRKMNEAVFNVLSCIPLVKIYSTQRQEAEKFASMSKDVQAIEFSMDKKRRLVPAMQELIMLVTVLLLISVMSLMVAKGRTGEISNFLVFFYLLRRVSTNFNFLNNIKVSFANVRGPFTAVSQIFDDDKKYFVKEGKKTFEGLRQRIDCNHLNFSYVDGQRVLDDVTVSIERGKITAIVGTTGSGKTTLINLILRYYDCPPASILFDGVDIREFTHSSLRSHMALVSQDIMLFNDTLRNNILYGMENISEKQLTEVVKKARLHEFAVSLPQGFDTFIGDRGVRLSGGEKQRVAIARAMLKNAEMLILDEATSSLDATTERLVQEALEVVMKNRTVIVIAHRLFTIRNADKIAVLENGRVDEVGTFDGLLAKKGRFYRYWEEQKFY